MKKRKDFVELRKDISRVCEFANELDHLKVICGDKKIYRLWRKELKRQTKLNTKPVEKI